MVGEGGGECSVEADSEASGESTGVDEGALCGDSDVAGLDVGAPLVPGVEFVAGGATLIDEGMRRGRSADSVCQSRCIGELAVSSAGWLDGDQLDRDATFVESGDSGLGVPTLLFVVGGDDFVDLVRGDVFQHGGVFAEALGEGVVVAGEVLVEVE